MCPVTKQCALIGLFATLKLPASCNVAVVMVVCSNEKDFKSSQLPFIEVPTAGDSCGIVCCVIGDVSLSLPQLAKSRLMPNMLLLVVKMERKFFCIHIPYVGYFRLRHRLCRIKIDVA